MSANASSPTAILWADPAQAGWLCGAMERAGVAIVGAGTPEPGRAAELATGLSGSRDAVPVFDDLRAVLTTAQADLVLITSPGDFAGGQRQGVMDREDAAVLAACRARGVRVATLEPMPCSALQLSLPVEPAASHLGAATSGDVLAAPTGAGIVLGPGAIVRTETESVRARRPIDAGGGWAQPVPLLRLCRACRDAADVLEQFGHIRAVHVEAWCGPSQGTLGARLFDALDCIVALLGSPEQVDATYVWPARGRAIHAAAGETLRGLSGDLSASLRFSDGRAATIAISDHAARWSRSLTLIGDGGRLHISDDSASRSGTGTGGFTWLAADGRGLDTSRPARRRRGQEERPDEALVDALADQLARLLDPRTPAPAPTDYAAVLAAAGAALLSARTGEAESSQTILRMAGGR